MKKSPKGLFQLEPSGRLSTADELEQFLETVSARAKAVIDDAGIKVGEATNRPADLARKRPFADKEAFALLVLHHVQSLRRRVAAAKFEGAEERALWVAHDMLQLCGAAFGGAFVQHEDVLRKGLQFNRRGKRPRRDNLAKLIDEALVKVGHRATNIAVLATIRSAHADLYVDDDQTIMWRGGGRERTTSFKAFCNRVAKRKKLFPKNK